MTITVDSEVLRAEVAALRDAAQAFDAVGVLCPGGVDGGAVTSLVTAWVADLCGAGAEELTVTWWLWRAGEAAEAELSRANYHVAADLAASLVFLGVGS